MILYNAEWFVRAIEEVKVLLLNYGSLFLGNYEDDTETQSLFCYFRPTFQIIVYVKVVDITFLSYCVLL